jgi:hypothetical protein
MPDHVDAAHGSTAGLARVVRISHRADVYG